MLSPVAEIESEGVFDKSQSGVLDKSQTVSKKEAKEERMFKESSSGL
jgi:hypothetical protein